MRDAVAIWQQVDTAIERFLVLETDIGMTFAEAARHALCTEECLRNRRLARRAYETAQRWTRRVRFSGEAEKTYCRKLQRLKEALNRLGDPVSGSGTQKPMESSNGGGGCV
jgi:hypothetical protein